MRVLESKPDSGMGRKHKLRKQSRENVVRVSDTSDDGAVAGEVANIHRVKNVTRLGWSVAAKYQTKQLENTQWNIY